MMSSDPFRTADRAARLARRMTREGRVQVLAEVADALAAGRAPDVDDARWLGAELLAWLLSSRPQQLCKALGLTAPRCSHRTPQWVYRQALIAMRASTEALAENSGIESSTGACNDDPSHDAPRP